jgi:hypothetical protein
MLLRLFKGTGPGVILLITITLLAVWLNALLHPGNSPDVLYETDPMPLYGLLKILINNSNLAGVIISSLVVSLMAFLLVNFNTNIFFINERTFLPGLIYILLGGLFPGCQLLNPVLPASVFLMLAIIRIMDGYHKTGTAYNYFDAGILISTGSLFYANLIWFGLLVIIGVALLRTGYIKEIVISVFGLLTPYVLTFGLYYVTGKDVLALIKLIGSNLFVKSTLFPVKSLTIAALIFTGACLLMSMIQLINHMNSKKIKSRKTFSLLIWAFLISVTAFFVLPSVSFEIEWLAGIPASYFLTHYFVFARKKLVPEILFSLLFLFVVLVQVFYLK